MFGDFSALESEERAKIDHVLRDGSNAVEVCNYCNMLNSLFGNKSPANGQSGIQALRLFLGNKDTYL